MAGGYFLRALLRVVLLAVLLAGFRVAFLVVFFLLIAKADPPPSMCRQGRLPVSPREHLRVNRVANRGIGRAVEVRPHLRTAGLNRSLEAVSSRGVQSAPSRPAMMMDGAARTVA